MKKAILFAVLVFVTPCSFSQRASLTGVKEFAVRVTEQTALLNMNADRIKDDVQAKLYLAGLPIRDVVDLRPEIERMPVLNVRVLTMAFTDKADELLGYSYTIYLNFNQRMLLARDVTYATRASTWFKLFLGVTGTDKTVARLHLRDMVRELTEQFIADFKLAQLRIIPDEPQEDFLEGFTPSYEKEQ